MPPNTIPARPIHDWCSLLSRRAPASQPIKAAEGSRMAICISFSACTSVAIPPEFFGCGSRSGIGRLKGIEALVQHTGPSRKPTEPRGERVYFPFGPMPPHRKETLVFDSEFEQGLFDQRKKTLQQ